MSSKPTKTSSLAFFILAVAGFSVYANSLDVPFYLDDFRNIAENSHIHIEKITLGGLWDAAFASPLVTRPVANVSFAFNYFLHRDNVIGYHLVNIAIHVLTGFFLYLLFSVTLSTPALLSKYRNTSLLAFLASLLWLVHPLHTGSVTYIVQRMVLLAGMFYVLALLCFVKGRMAHSRRLRWGWILGSLFFAVLAMGSKEIAATLPFTIFLYEWYFFQDLDREWLRKKLWLIGVLLLFVAIGYVLYAGSFATFFAGYDNRPFTLMERLYTEPRVVLFYVNLLLYPHPGRLNLDHSIPVSHSLVDPVTTALSAGGIVFLLLLSIFLAKKQRVISFALLWFLGNLVIESSFLGLELIFEHRTYLPSMFMLLAFTVLIKEYVRPRKFGVSILVVAVVVCSYWTIERNRVWRDPVLFWTDSAAKSPKKARPYMNLSVALRERGDLDGAIVASKKAISIDPGFVNGFVGLGAAYAEKGEFDKSVTEYKKALQRMPDYAEVYNALGVVYIKQGRIKEAVAAFDENLRLDPTDVNALVNRASTMAYQGYFAKAIADFNKALEAGGRNPDILFNLAVAYTGNGDADKAIEIFEEVLHLNPGDRQARANLKQLRSRMAR